MKTLKKLTKIIFYKHYGIRPLEKEIPEELSFACDGRIIRSLTDSKKRVCGAYILNGIEK